MASFIPPTGFLSYNNSDLIRDGFVSQSQTRIHNIPSSKRAVWEKRLKSGKKGVIYSPYRDAVGQLIQVEEQRKILPAEKMKIEIRFSKTMKNAVTHPIDPTFTASPIANLSGAVMLASSMGFGGITSGTTLFSYNIIDSETVINEKLEITEEIYENLIQNDIYIDDIGRCGVLEFENPILSVFGVVKEHISKYDDFQDEENRASYQNQHPEAVFEKTTSGYIAKVGIDFTQDDIENIGRFTSGVYQGGPRSDIKGATDEKGLFGGNGIPYVDISIQGEMSKPNKQFPRVDGEKILFSEQENLFVQILRDKRKYKFRGDNDVSSNLKQYPFSSNSFDDATDNCILIKMGELKVGDVLYLTYSTCSKHYLRQCVRHVGKVGQGNTIGVVGWKNEIGSELDVFNYKFMDWKVPHFEKNNFEVTNYALHDLQRQEYSFKDNNDTYYPRFKLNNNDLYKIEQEELKYDILKGWRLTEVLTKNVDKFWGIDKDGIFLYKDGSKTYKLTKNKIRDKEWFDAFIKSIIDKQHTFYNLYDSNASLKIDKDSLEDTPSLLFDISEITNLYNYDKEKIPYHISFVIALESVSSFLNDKEWKNSGNIGENTSGVGISLLDNLDNIDMTIPSDNNVEQMRDLSYAEFDILNSKFAKSIGCSERRYITVNHYECHTYDPEIYLSNDWIEQHVFEWRPSGSTIESYWELETPYFCDDFSRSARVYIEDISGKSLNNFSSIYVDTSPYIPSSISVDRNDNIDMSWLVFEEPNVFRSLSYHRLRDFELGEALKSLEVDTNRNHEYDIFQGIDTGSYNDLKNLHNDRKLMGLDRILGDRPSYSHGRCISNTLSEVCFQNLKDFFVHIDLLDLSNYASLVTDGEIAYTSHEIRIQPNSYLRELEIEFKYKDNAPKDMDRYASFIFKDSDSGIMNVLPKAIEDGGAFYIDLKYYQGNGIFLLGEIWDHIIITKAELVIVDKRVERFKNRSSQSAVIDDGYGRVYVFYSDISSSNISVMISEDGGLTWKKFTDIVRLTKGESLSFPVLIKDDYTETVHLYYILNNEFLMYKRIYLHFFNEADEFISYEPLGSYDESTDESDISSYSEDGQTLRKSSSYFIAGDSESSYFKKQIEIASKKEEKGEVPRFNFTGDLSSLDESFSVENYAISIDNTGLIRLLYIKDNLLYMKNGNDFRSFAHTVGGLEFHRYFKNEQLNKGEQSKIKNIQIAKNLYGDEDIGLLPVFYFCDGMLFLRVLSLDAMSILEDDPDRLIEEHISVDQENQQNISSKPIFVIGDIPDNIKNIKIEEIKNNVSDEDSELFIEIPYSLQIIEKMDSGFAVDDNTQVLAMILDNSVILVYYKDYNGELNSLYIDSLKFSVPTIVYKQKEKQEDNG